jgi:hypothetical protein
LKKGKKIEGIPPRKKRLIKEKSKKNVSISNKGVLTNGMNAG